MKRPDLKITVLTKSTESQSNTSYAQGEVAAVWDQNMDNFQKHIEDKLKGGDGICIEPIGEIVVKEGPDRIRDIIEWGARFDKNKSGNYDLGKEGGHSENRILHYKDITGWEIQRTLNEKAREFKNIE